MMTADALADLIGAAEGAGIRFISDEIYHGLDYAFAAATAAQFSERAMIINSFSKYFCMTGWRIGWMVVPETLVRPIERLQQNLCDLGADAVADRRRGRLRRARRDGGGQARLRGQPADPGRRAAGGRGSTASCRRTAPSISMPTSRASPTDSHDFAQRMLAEAHVAVTPGVDFDPAHGREFIRLCYACSRADTQAAVERIGRWLGGR